MEGAFDDEGYQVILIKTFNEMLGIRDTIQSPILMTENRDETATRFLIPTHTHLLYVHEIRVDNYDEIYGIYAEDADNLDELANPVAAEATEENQAEAPVETERDIEFTNS